MARISEIMLLQQVEQPVLEITTKTNLQGIAEAIGSGFMKIGQYMDELGETLTDVPYVSYPSYESMNENDITIVVGFKTARPLPAKDEIKSTHLPPRKIVLALYMGTYEEMVPFYAELAAWIKEKGYSQNGDTYEYFYTGPEIPETKHVTRVELPLK